MYHENSDLIFLIQFPLLPTSGDLIVEVKAHGIELISSGEFKAIVLVI